MFAIACEKYNITNALFVSGLYEARVVENGVKLAGIKMQGIRMTAVQHKSNHAAPLCQAYSFVPYMTEVPLVQTKAPSVDMPARRTRRFSTLIAPDMLSRKSFSLPSERNLKICLDIAMENTMKSQINILIAGSSELLLPVIEMLKSILNIVFFGQFQLYFACHESQVEQVKNFASMDRILVHRSNGTVSKFVELADILILVDDSFNSKIKLMPSLSFTITMTEGLEGMTALSDPNNSNVTSSDEELVKIAQFLEASSKCVLYRKVTTALVAMSTVEIRSGNDFQWVEELKEKLKEAKSDTNSRVWLLCDGQLHGVVGLVNCLLQEAAGKHIR